MLRLLRRRMLEAFLETPHGVGADLTWGERVSNLSLSAAVVAFNAVVGVMSHHYFFNVLRWSLLKAVGVTVGSVAAITVGLYVYYVYLVDLGKKKPAKDGKHGHDSGKEKKN